MNAQSYVRATAAAIVMTLLAGCGGGGGGGGGGDAGSNSAPTSEETAVVETPAANLPNACTIFAKTELENAVGSELRDGEPEDASAGSACEFEGVAGAYATQTFPNPPLPASAGFGGLTVTVYPSKADTFAQGKAQPGAEPVSGLGDDAYFNGFYILQVRKGGSGFSLRMSTDAQSSGDQEKVKAVLQSLARSGLPRL